MATASSSNASTTATGTAVTLTLPTWTLGTGGDLIFLWVCATVSTTISTPTGYWPVMITQPGTPTVALFAKYARTGDSGAAVSIILGTASSWSITAFVPTAGSATSYIVDTNSLNANHAASTTGAFIATSRNTSNVPTIGTAGGAIGIEFFAGLPGSGQTDTLTVPTGYGNSVAKASTKTTSVNVSSLVASLTTATITAGTAYTPPSITQSVSVKFSNVFISIVPASAMTGVVQYATFGGTGTAPGFGAGPVQPFTLPKAPTVGNLLILMVSNIQANNADVSMSPAIGATGGFTIAYGGFSGTDGVSTGPNGAILYRYVLSGDDAWSLGDSNGWASFTILEISNPNPTTPFDGTASWKANTTGGPQPMSDNGVTPTNTGDIAITFACWDGWPDYNITGTGTPWDTFTPVGMQNSALYSGNMWAHKDSPTVGSAITSNWTQSGGGTQSQFAITFLINQGTPTVSQNVTPNAVAGAMVNGTTSVSTATSQNVSLAAVKGQITTPVPQFSSAVALAANVVAGATVMSPVTLSTSTSLTSTAVAGQTVAGTQVVSSGASPVSVAVAGATVVGTPTLIANSTVTAVAVNSSTGIPQPTLNVGSNISPVVLAGATIVPMPVESVGSNVTTVAVAGQAVMPNPSVSVSGNANIGTSAVKGTLIMGAQTNSVGITLTTIAIAGAMVPGVQQLSTGSSISPTVVNGPTPTPSVATVTTTAGAAPSPVMGQVVFGTPLVANGVTIPMSAFIGQAGFTLPTVNTGSGVSPTAFAGATIVPAPTVITSIGTVIAPTVFVGATVMPPPVITSPIALTTISAKGTTRMIIPIVHPSTLGRVKIWNGTAWVTHQVKIWQPNNVPSEVLYPKGTLYPGDLVDGSWVPHDLKYFNGISWVRTLN